MCFLISAESEYSIKDCKCRYLQIGGHPWFNLIVVFRLNECPKELVACQFLAPGNWTSQAADPSFWICQGRLQCRPEVTAAGRQWQVRNKLAVTWRVPGGPDPRWQWDIDCHLSAWMLTQGCLLVSLPSDTIAEFLRCALLFWSKRMWRLKCESSIFYLEVWVSSCQLSVTWVRKKIQLYWGCPVLIIRWNH